MGVVKKCPKALFSTWTGENCCFWDITEWPATCTLCDPWIKSIQLSSTTLPWWIWFMMTTSYLWSILQQLFSDHSGKFVERQFEWIGQTTNVPSKDTEQSWRHGSKRSVHYHTFYYSDRRPYKLNSPILPLNKWYNHF